MDIVLLQLQVLLSQYQVVTPKGLEDNVYTPSLQYQTSTLFSCLLSEMWEVLIRWLDSADAIAEGTWIVVES